MKKRYGQNFLKSSKWGFRMLEIINPPEAATFLEIGPGNGAITTAILEKGHKVVSVEIDYDLLPDLIKQFYDDNSDAFDIIHADFLEFDLEKFVQENNVESLFIVGNLPFNAGRDILQKIEDYVVQSDSQHVITSCAFILQEEVTINYSANPPKATKFSATMSLWAHAKKHENISSRNFVPKPKVDAAILEVTPREALPTYFEQAKKLIHFGFVSPKKKLRNNLRAGLHLPKVDIDDLLTAANIDLSLRAHEVSREMWISLAEQYAKL